MEARTERRDRPREDWADESFVAYWLEREGTRSPDRFRQFAVVRSLIPRHPDESFTYINVAGGDGSLDEVLLAKFSKAHLTLVDGSQTMVDSARERLAPFGERVSVARADLSGPDWVSSVQGPFDCAVSTIALHNLRAGGRLRALYGEIFSLLGDGGFFLNFDYVRPASPALRTFQRWATGDPDACYIAHSSGTTSPGTLIEQFAWLHEAGFTAVDCFWKQFAAAAFGGFKGVASIPSAE
jgi:tRNA (cmo5U34)-methyltransferase